MIGEKTLVLLHLTLLMLPSVVNNLLLGVVVHDVSGVVGVVDNGISLRFIKFLVKTLNGLRIIIKVHKIDLNLLSCSICHLLSFICMVSKNVIILIVFIVVKFEEL
jgi:hypothetical protein